MRDAGLRRVRFGAAAQLLGESDGDDVELGSWLGSVLGSWLGSWLGSVLGSWLGSWLGSVLDDGSCDWTHDSAEESSVESSDVSDPAHPSVAPLESLEPLTAIVWGGRFTV
jgi:hypothetical protein